MRVTLVDELVEGMLSVGPRLAPHDWSGVVLHTGTVFGDVLPIRFHVALTTTEIVQLVTVRVTAGTLQSTFDQESFESVPP